MDKVRIVNAALDEDIDGDIVLRGAVDNDSLRLLQVGDYQREVLPLKTLGSLVEAMKAGQRVPDVVLSMRGQRFNSRSDVYLLEDDVYIVDGLQRISAAMHLMQLGNLDRPRIGAKIHFGKDEDWERQQFFILNKMRTPLSPNVLIRNLAHDNHAIEMLLNLANDRAFVLHDRVCWAQRMRRQDLITARSYVRVAGWLHSHVVRAATHSQLETMSAGLNRIVDTIGRGVMRDNVKGFFDILDECYGVKRIAFKEGATYMHGVFLLALATLFSRHQDFWDGDRLFVNADTKRKLAGFPVADPHVTVLCKSSGTAAQMMVSNMLAEHVNSGRKKHRLRSRGETEAVADAAA